MVAVNYVIKHKIKLFEFPYISSTFWESTSQSLGKTLHKYTNKL